MTINWCPVDMIGLANEEVINGCCERCGNVVEKKEKEQWMLAITKYADRLDKDLDETDFIEKVKIQQRNWIGKSEGAFNPGRGTRERDCVGMKVEIPMQNSEYRVRDSSILEVGIYNFMIT